MSTQRSRLGDCPDCGAAIQARHVLIEYDTDSGPGIWAEFPRCAAVAHPR
jgi:hypothetical protein